MSRFLLALSVMATFAATNLKADQPPVVQTSASSAPAEMTTISANQVTATPEMWFYEQEMRRYDDPRTAIRANAALKTAQRQARLAAMQWYGLSNSRPLAGCDPFHGVYITGWVSNGYMPNEWVGQPGPTTILYAPRTSGY
jgi:hypothetical protein